MKVEHRSEARSREGQPRFHVETLDQKKGTLEGTKRRRRQKGRRETQTKHAKKKQKRRWGKGRDQITGSLPDG